MTDGYHIVREGCLRRTEIRRARRESGPMNKSLTRVHNTWNHLGELDPMWAILTVPSKFGGRWSEPEFFASGKSEVDALMTRLDRIVPNRRSLRALDFGCGIGRLARALTEHYERVDAVDVAPSMIALAKERNVAPDRCTFHLNVAADLALFEDATFDLIYSNIVLQHIAPGLARKYLAEFARCARPDGLIVFQLPHRRLINAASIKRFIMHGVYRVVPSAAVRWYRRRKHRALPRPVVDGLPKIPMEVHSIPRPRVESILRDCGLLGLENSSTRNDAFVSYTYVFQKRAAITPGTPQTRIPTPQSA
jgi:SAM-dependent methyltransferase